MKTQALKDLIQQNVRETVRAVLREERLAFFLALIPRVSKQEMAEIRNQFGAPSKYDKDDFANTTDWVRNGAKPE